MREALTRIGNVLSSLSLTSNVCYTLKYISHCITMALFPPESLMDFTHLFSFLCINLAAHRFSYSFNFNFSEQSINFIDLFQKATVRCLLGSQANIFWLLTSSRYASLAMYQWMVTLTLCPLPKLPMESLRSCILPIFIAIHEFILVPIIKRTLPGTLEWEFIYGVICNL